MILRKAGVLRPQVAEGWERTVPSLQVLTGCTRTVPMPCALLSTTAAFVGSLIPASAVVRHRSMSAI